jgi:hypothetical protein
VAVTQIVENPWFGPYFGVDGFRVVISSGCLQLLPGVTYALTLSIFDEEGRLRAQKEVGRCVRHRPVTVDVGWQLPDLPPLRGMVALLLRPDSVMNVATPAEAWTVRFVGSQGFEETVVSELPPSINAAGKRSSFRLVSSQVLLEGDWRPLIAVSNASCDPSYDRFTTVLIEVRNADGEVIQSVTRRIAPFGTAWFDLLEVFGDGLRGLLAATGGRGSCVMYSQDTAAVGYHFLYSPEAGRLAGDHTRPMLRYITTGYGTSRFSTDDSLLFGVQALTYYVFSRLRIGRRTS